MEKLMQRENAFLGHDAPKTSYTRSSGDLDFEDVFGGPPRRFSMQEVKIRYSFGETVEESEEERALSPWSSEKPVFGEESVLPRRQHQGDDFFDDIFGGGGESSCISSPRRADRDRDGSVFGSNPGSRIMSPARSLPPKIEPFGTSLPAQFSLPAKLTKTMDRPTFGSRNHGIYKTDGSTNGLKTSNSSSSLSRFSNQTIRSQSQEEIRNEVHKSPLSRETSFSSEEDSPPTVTLTSDQKDNFENLKKDTKNGDSFGNQFHFSIYKWAGRGVPMLMTLVAGNNLKSKDNRKYNRCASSNGRMESDLSKEEDKKELLNSIEEVCNETPESKLQSGLSDTVVFGGAREDIKEQVRSLDESDTRERTVKEVPLKMEDSLKFEVKPLHAFLNAEVEQQGKITEVKETKSRTPREVHVTARDSKNVKKSYGTVIDSRNATVEKSNLQSDAIKIPKEVHATARDSKNVKKNEGLGIDSRNASVEKSDLQSDAINSGVSPRKSVVKGKVKDFVHIFNQEADSRPKADVRRRSQSSSWKNIEIDQKDDEVSSNAAKAKERENLHNADKKPDFSLKVDESLKKDEVQKNSPTKTPTYTSNDSPTKLKRVFSSETLNRDPKISAESTDDPIEVHFMIQELSDDHEKVTESESSEDTKAIDAKIRQWSVGKKGNIRSLLSTLQYVLWPDSGWKPVPLVDLIEANSVKRAYQKALLRLHPDKLQQKGAAFHQKYTAEKVFDILQEAWDHFNTCSSLNL